MAICKRIPEIRSISFDLGDVKHSPENRIEVMLSPALLGSVRAAADALIRQNVYPIPGTDNLERYLADLRYQYQSVCSQLVHRVETDLKPEEVTLLHFALLKGVMTTVRDTLRNYCNTRKQRAEELKQRGSEELLKVQDQLAWFYQHADLIHYRVMKNVLRELRRVESRYPHTLWQQTAKVAFNSSAILFTPLTAVGERPTEQYLFDHLFLCEDFTQCIKALNETIEAACIATFTSAKTLPLFEQQTSIITVNNDVSHPPWANFLSSANPAQQPVSEQLCWLDDPEAIWAVLTNSEADNAKHGSDAEPHFASIKLSLGQRWQLFRLRRRLVRILKRHRIQSAVLATEQSRRLWPTRTGRQIDYNELFRFLNGELSLRKLTSQLTQDNRHKADLIKTLRQSRKEIKQQLSRSPQQFTWESLALIAKFRSHLKFCRFTQRMFSSIDLVSWTNSAPQLPHQYVALSTDEIRANKNNSVANECVLTLQAPNMDNFKRVLRGQGYDPDEFLNKHFFDSVQKKIHSLGAEQEYRDGQSWQLLLREYQSMPEKWHTISHATAIAEQMLESSEYLKQQCLASHLPQIAFSITIDYHDIFAGQPSFRVTNDKYSKTSDDAAQNDLLSTQVILTSPAFRKLQQEARLRLVSQRLQQRTEVFYTGSLQLPDNVALDILLKEFPRRSRHHRYAGHEVCYELLKQTTRDPSVPVPGAKRYQPRPMMLHPDR